MSAIDILRSFAEARCADGEIVRDGISYGVCREAMAALARKDRVIRILLDPPPLCGDSCRAWRARLCTKTDIARWDSDDCRGRRLRAAEAEADKENDND